MCCCRMLKSNFFDILNFTKTIEINNLNPAKTVGQLGSVDGKWNSPWVNNQQKSRSLVSFI